MFQTFLGALNTCAFLLKSMGLHRYSKLKFGHVYHSQVVQRGWISLEINKLLSFMDGTNKIN